MIGSGMSGGVRNVLVESCTFDGTRRGIRLKAMRGRGGVVENVCYRDITMHRIVDEAVTIDLHYPDPTVEARLDAPPVFRDVRISRVRCTGAGTAVRLRGLPEQSLEHITLENLRISAGKGFSCEDVRNLQMRGVDITCDTHEGPTCGVQTSS